MPRSDVTIYNASADEPGGVNTTAFPHGAQINLQNSGVAAFQPSVSQDVNITGASVTVSGGTVQASGGQQDPPVFTSGQTYESGINLTADQGWRTINDIVNGWDWAFPSTHVRAPAAGGIAQQPGQESVSSYFEGPRLFKIDARWRDLEPTEGNYDFSSIFNQLNSLPSEYNGVWLNIRGNVIKMTDENGDDIRQWAWTTPTWLVNKLAAAGVEPWIERLFDGVGGQFRHHNARIATNMVKQGWFKLIAELGNSGMASHPSIHGQLLHGVSHSLGEEWAGDQASDSAASAAMIEIIDKWIEIYQAAGTQRKLMWLKPNEPGDVWTQCVINGGTGARAGGSMERFLQFDYTPGVQEWIGFVAEATVYDESDSEGFEGEMYIYKDPNFIVTADDRAFQEQNEITTSINSANHFCYRGGHLRSIAMGLNELFVSRDRTLDPRLEWWASYQLGQRPELPSAEGFCWLVQGYSNSGSGQVPFGQYKINNIEAWVYQREAYGATTLTNLTPTLKQIASPSSRQEMYLSRRGTSIRFAVDPRLISGAQPVIVKVTYRDTNTKTWTLRYDNGGGVTSGSRSFQNSNSGNVRTVTWFLDDFQNNQTGTVPGNITPTLRLDSDGTIDFMFVRIIKQ